MTNPTIDLICFSHLRWDFVFQRPQHLMTRFAREGRVFFVEEPVWTNAMNDDLQIRQDRASGVQIVVPALTEETSTTGADDRIRGLLDGFMLSNQIKHFVSWYYSPMALAFSSHLRPDAIVYDCMDELSAFQGAPTALVSFERELFAVADIVFTGGNRLYEAKRRQHDNIFSFPSSIDKVAFAPARVAQPDPEDQAAIAHPRFGFFGVIDERFDTELVRRMAVHKPEWQFIFIGPVVKIDPGHLPRYENVHYLGIKQYQELSRYIAGWDICIMPFAINASTEFISPTKTPEFLAAGKQVISTPIHDVVHPYGDENLVGIADSAEAFISIASGYLAEVDKTEWLTRADAFLATLSWDQTWQGMKRHIEDLLAKETSNHAKKKLQHV